MDGLRPPQRASSMKIWCIFTVFSDLLSLKRMKTLKEIRLLHLTSCHAVSLCPNSDLSASKGSLEAVEGPLRPPRRYICDSPMIYLRQGFVAGETPTSPCGCPSSAMSKVGDVGVSPAMPQGIISDSLPFPADCRILAGDFVIL